MTGASFRRKVWLGVLLFCLAFWASVAYVVFAPSAKAQTVSSLFNAGSMVDQQVVTLDASGNATWNFTVQFPGVPAVVHLPKQNGTADALICNWTSISSTSVTIHCWKTNVAAGLLTGLLGGAVSGQQVSLVARYIP